MLTAMEKLGVPITEDIYVCRPCSEPAMGGFVPEEGIVLCQNNIRRQAYMDATLAHELIHAYDYAKFDIAWDNCRHHACSEVVGGAKQRGGRNDRINVIEAPSRREKHTNENDRYFCATGACCQSQW